MPDFVRQGEHVDEAEAAQEQSAAVIEEEDPSERKSLYDQLREDKERKQEQFRAQFDSQNSGYKLDEKSATFYQNLLQEKQNQEIKEKLYETREISRFNQLKQKKSSSINSITPIIKSTKIIKNSNKIIVKKSTKKPIKTQENSNEKQFQINSNISTNIKSTNSIQSIPKSSISSLVGQYSSDED